MSFQPSTSASNAARLTRTSDARRERGRLRTQLADLMHTDAPRSEVEPVRTRIQQLNTFIQEQDGHP